MSSLEVYNIVWLDRLDILRTGIVFIEDKPPETLRFVLVDHVDSFWEVNFDAGLHVKVVQCGIIQTKIRLFEFLIKKHEVCSLVEVDIAVR